MKMSMRLKYMGKSFVDMITAIGGFLIKVGMPVVITIGLIALMNFIPWWASALITATVILAVYMWIHAETQYKEDYEVSRGLLYDKYNDFTDRWIAKVNGGQSFRAIYLQMTPLIDEYDTLLACHKNLYGEDDIYKLYSDRIDRFIKCQEESEKNREEGVFLI
jgi:hypothetical protein